MADCFTPGSFLKASIRQRGLTQRAFAETLGLRPSHVSEILSDKRGISVALAARIQESIGVSANDILASQIQFNATNRESAMEAQAAMELSKLDELVCVDSFFAKELRNSLSNVEKIDLLKKHYNVSTEEQIFDACGCFRRSAKTGGDLRMIRTWLLKAQREIREAGVIKGTFRASDIDDVSRELSAVFHENDNTIYKVMTTLSKYGVRFCVVGSEKHASIDGYSCVIDGIPAIVITLRYKRIDNLAFSIMHELCHIYRHLSRDGNARLSFTRDSVGISREEAEADTFASESLIPSAIWSTAPQVAMNPFVIQKEYTKWAQCHNLNKWIVLGRISHETGMYMFKSDDFRNIK